MVRVVVRMLPEAGVEFPEMDIPLMLDAGAVRGNIHEHHPLRHPVAHDAESLMGQQSLQHICLPPPVPVPILRPMPTLNPGTVHSLDGPEQLRHPFSLPIGQLLFSNSFP